MLKSEPVDAASPELQAALIEAGLPVADLLSSRPSLFQFSDGDQTVAFGGFELLGASALLRSLVVVPKARGQGHGHMATHWLLNEVAANGVQQVFLFTNTAAGFFQICGFNPVNRADAPPEILATNQASGLCPASATLMEISVPNRIYNVLFLCTGNSARSILAESILQKEGQGRFHAFSAGSQPKGQVHPLALKVLQAMDYPSEGFRSKAWDEFAGDGAPVMDFVFTVCDNAAGEVCPIWPGQPMTAHWGIEDPAAVQGSDIEKERAFTLAARQMKARISEFTSLPLSSVNRLSLSASLRSIGELQGSTRRRE